MKGLGTIVYSLRNPKRKIPALKNVILSPANRRIVCYAKTGDTLRKAEILGLIRFGSSIDLHLPTEVKPIVRIGQHVKTGESIIGYRL